MIGLCILVIPLAGNLSGPAMTSLALLLSWMVHIMPGVAETRLRLNLCLRCLCMTLRRSRLRKLYWKLNLSVIEALGLHIRVVLPSPNPLSVLCKVGQLELLTGQRFENITGPGLWQLLRVLAVFCAIAAMALFICDRCMLPMLATRQFILFILTVVVGTGLGETILILSRLRAVRADTTETCLCADRRLLTICMQAIMLWQALHIELKTSVWVGVLVILAGVGMR